MGAVFTIGDVARRRGIPLWMVRRLYERGLLPPAPRLGPYRVVTEEDLPAIDAALKSAGYLSRKRRPRRATPEQRRNKNRPNCAIITRAQKRTAEGANPPRSVSPS